MNSKITDLPDSDRDKNNLLGTTENAELEGGPIMKVQESKHRVRWQTVVGIAAALAILVGAAFLALPKLRRNTSPAAKGSDTQPASTESAAAADRAATDEPALEKADVIGCFQTRQESVILYANGAAQISDGSGTGSPALGTWKIDGRHVCCDAEGAAYVFDFTEDRNLAYMADLSKKTSQAAQRLTFEDNTVFTRQTKDQDPEYPDDYEPKPEYAVHNAIPGDGASDYENVFAPRAGQLRTYLYMPLPAAADYVETLRAYTAEAFGRSADEIEDEASDVYADGYANHALNGPDGDHATVSGNDQTGRFSYHRVPSEDEILNELAVTYREPEDLEASARAFMDRFVSITGPLKRTEMKVEDQSYLVDTQPDGWVHVQTVTFCFEAEQGHGDLLAQDGLTLPIQCSNAESSNPEAACFSVTVGMNGKVLFAENCVTLAETVEDSWKEVPTEDNIPGILSYVTSFTENDTLILHRVEASRYAVYFGENEILPVIDVTYSYASNPSEIQTMEIVLDAPLEP